MLIKGTDGKGNAVPLSPEEALKPAVGRACKALNTLEKVYCADARTIQGDGQVKSLMHQNGVWEAWAEGTANIGYVDTKTGHFHLPVPHTFKLHYRLAKDEWGLPDIEMATAPEIVPIERDPSKMVGPLPIAETPAVQLKAMEDGIANAKIQAQKRSREIQDKKQ